MPIPFLEALRGRLAPVFNGTVPLEREKEEKGHKRGLAGERGGRRRKTAQTHNKRHTNSAHLLRSRCGAEAEEVQIMKKKKKKALTLMMMWGS